MRAALEEALPEPPNPTAEEIALHDAVADRSSHARRMQQNADHYMAELATKDSHTCRWHRCFEQITEGGLCVKHNERRWD